MCPCEIKDFQIFLRVGRYPGIYRQLEIRTVGWAREVGTETKEIRHRDGSSCYCLSTAKHPVLTHAPQPSIYALHPAHFLALFSEMRFSASRLGSRVHLFFDLRWKPREILRDYKRNCLRQMKWGNFLSNHTHTHTHAHTNKTNNHHHHHKNTHTA